MKAESMYRAGVKKYGKAGMKAYRVLAKPTKK